MRRAYLQGSVADGATRFGGGSLTLKQFNNGASNPTYFIQTPAGEQFVVRKKPPGELLPGAHAVDREYRVQQALQGTDVPVPEVLALCDDDSVLGSMFYVMKFVPGRILQDNRLPEFSAAERGALYADICRVLAALHSLDYKEIGLEGYSRRVGNYAGDAPPSRPSYAHPHASPSVPLGPGSSPGLGLRRRLGHAHVLAHRQ